MFENKAGLQFAGKSRDAAPAKLEGTQTESPGGGAPVSIFLFLVNLNELFE